MRSPTTRTNCRMSCRRWPGPAAGPNGGQIYIDGFTGGQLPPKSSIREIRINQNPFSAEYDRLGYGRIEIFTKPGTDKIHGEDQVARKRFGLQFAESDPELRISNPETAVGATVLLIEFPRERWRSNYQEQFIFRERFLAQQQNENIVEAINPAETATRDAQRSDSAIRVRASTSARASTLSSARRTPSPSATNFFAQCRPMPASVR